MMLTIETICRRLQETRLYQTAVDSASWPRLKSWLEENRGSWIAVRLSTARMVVADDFPNWIPARPVARGDRFALTMSLVSMGKEGSDYCCSEDFSEIVASTPAPPELPGA
jgi:hypothetical protein